MRILRSGGWSSSSSCFSTGLDRTFSTRIPRDRNWLLRPTATRSATPEGQRIDRERRKSLMANRIVVLRFSMPEIADKPEAVLERIATIFAKLRAMGGALTPHSAANAGRGRALTERSIYARVCSTVGPGVGDRAGDDRRARGRRSGGIPHRQSRRAVPRLRRAIPDEARQGHRARAAPTRDRRRTGLRSAGRPHRQALPGLAGYRPERGDGIAELESAKDRKQEVQVARTQLEEATGPRRGQARRRAEDPGRQGRTQPGEGNKASDLAAIDAKIDLPQARRRDRRSRASSGSTSSAPAA